VSTKGSLYSAPDDCGSCDDDNDHDDDGDGGDDFISSRCWLGIQRYLWRRANIS